jgi:hypothetical protein
MIMPELPKTIPNCDFFEEIKTGAEFYILGHTLKKIGIRHALANGNLFAYNSPNSTLYLAAYIYDTQISKLRERLRMEITQRPKHPSAGKFFQLPLYQENISDNYVIYRDDYDGETHIGPVGSGGGTVCCGQPSDTIIEVPHQEVTCILCKEAIYAAMSYCFEHGIPEFKKEDLQSRTD